MLYDPLGTGAGPNDVLVRRGQHWESARRLAMQASLAEQAGVAVNGTPFGHGVSVTSFESNRLLARDPHDASRALRKDFEEAGFFVRYTPGKKDHDHHTIQLPKPVTEEVAARFNTILGRRKGP